MVDSPPSVTCRDADDMATRMARRLQGFSHEVRGRPFQVALSGGKTPRTLYRLLAREPFRSGIHWPGLEFFFSDERAVPPDDPQSNFGMVREILLAHVDVPAHRMQAEFGDEDGYQRLLDERVPDRLNGVPMLDLILLGIGTDGHTASLFPCSSAIRERTRWVVMNEIPRLDTRRMTLTYPLINAAKRVWIMAVGSDKRQIVTSCLAQAPDPDAWTRFPVLGVRPAHELLWWLDREAAP